MTAPIVDQENLECLIGAQEMFLALLGPVGSDRRAGLVCANMAMVLARIARAHGDSRERFLQFCGEAFDGVPEAEIRLRGHKGANG
jgi:hypothetical protein